MNQSTPLFSEDTTPIPPPDAQPVRVGLPQTMPYVSYTILAICVLVFLLQIASELTLGYDLPARLGMKINEAIRAGQFWRLLTPMLLHGGIVHIGFNMYALFNLGPGLERSYGHARFLILFVLGGIAGNLMSFALTTAPSLGSSTAIFGLLAAEGVFIYQNRKLFGGQSRAALTQVVSVAAVNLMIGFAGAGLIDNWGHLGGLLGGLAFAWFAGPLLAVEGFFPNFFLKDQRSPASVLTAATGVAAVLAILTLILVLR